MLSLQLVFSCKSLEVAWLWRYNYHQSSFESILAVSYVLLFNSRFNDKIVLQLSWLELLFHVSAFWWSFSLFFILTYLVFRIFLSKEYSGLNGFSSSYGLLIGFSIELTHQTDLSGVLKLNSCGYVLILGDAPLKKLWLAEFAGL